MTFLILRQSFPAVFVAEILKSNVKHYFLKNMFHLSIMVLSLIWSNFRSSKVSRNCTYVLKNGINRSTRLLIDTLLTNYWHGDHITRRHFSSEVSLHQQTSDTMQTTNPPIISLCTLLNLNLNPYNQYLVLLLLFYQTVIMRQAFDRLGRKCPYLLIAPS